VQQETGAPWWNQWWKLGGVAGILWIVLFIAGAFILQGETPSRDDDIAEIREYFTDDAEQYLIGDYLIGLGFVFGFIPYLVVMRRVLGGGLNLPGMLSRIAFVGGILTVVMAAGASVFWGTLAVGAAESSEVDDSAIRIFMEADVYAFNTLVFFISLFLLAAGLSLWMTGVLNRWLGWIGIIGGIGGFIGAAWPIDGDEEGLISGIGLLSFIGILLFIIATSVALLMKKEPPVADLEVGPDRTVV
jgi:hypothetical protein